MDLSDDSVANATENFYHASILKMKQTRNSPDCFFFKLINIEDTSL